LQTTTLAELSLQILQKNSAAANNLPHQQKSAIGTQNESFQSMYGGCDEMELPHVPKWKFGKELGTDI
jgi:hypothetical protein